MSGKGFQTKVPEVENTDSGFLSGPIDRFPDDVEEAEVEEKAPSDSGNVKCVTEEHVDIDSGLDLCLSGCLDSLVLSEGERPALEGTKPSLDRADIPPLAILFQQDNDGDTQLHIAAVHGCEKSVSTLISVCPDKYFLDLPNDYGHTALHLAVMSGHPVVAKMLLRAGASLGLRDLRGDTPIHAATRANNDKCLQALLAPEDNQRLSKNLASILNLKNYQGQTCVHLAATAGQLSTLKILVYYGADINAREGLAGWTPLHIAARRGDVALAQYLLQRCAGVLPAPRDYAGRTPRRLAAKHAAFAKDGQRLFKPTQNDDSETETDTEDEYDSDDPETLFDKIRGSIATAVATN